MLLPIRQASDENEDATGSLIKAKGV